MAADEATKEPTRREWVGYWSMIVQQTQNAFNDKAAQFLLIPLGGWLLGTASRVEHLAGLLIVAPFILFAPVAGWLSDRFSKRDVMVGAAVAQLLILGLLAAALGGRQLGLGMFGFFLLAAQSAFFSPAKMGIVKELVGSKHLGFASGVQQMTALIAILIGQVSMGYLFDARLEAGHDGWASALRPLLALALFALPAIGMAWIVPRTPAHGAGRLTVKLCVSHLGQMCDLWRDAVLRRTAFGIAFFWGFAGFINLWSIGVAKELTGGGAGFGVISSHLMLAASIGMATGFGAASVLCRRRIELGWVPLAGVAMTVFTLAIAWLDADTPWFLVVLGCAAFAAAVFLVPLNAYLQDIVDPAQRGRILAAMNLQDCFAGVVAVVLQFGFTAVHGALGRPVWLGPRGQVVFAAVLSAVVTWRVARRLPSDMIRVIGLPVVRWWYRTRALHAGRVPGRGGVLLLVNHLTFADAFVVTALCPRPVRFVMAAEFERNRWVRGFTRLFNTVPLDGSRPREAIRAAVAALEAGDIVCVFPEGQLSRLGVMNELRRGFELIARHGGCPVIPLYVDGMWGSFFSSEGGGFFRRHRCRRLPVIGAFGEVLDPGAATAAAVRHGLRAAAADCLAERVTAAGLDMLGGADGGAAEARRWLANGCQVWATAAAPRAEGFYAWADDPEATALHGLVRVLPRWFGVPVHWLGPDEQPAAGRRVLGGTVARERLVAAGTPVAFDDFSAVIVPLPAGIEHFPALAVDGIVVAMSMPDPPRPLAGSLQQLGVRAGCRGRLLPGFVLVAGGGGELRLGGPACPPAGLALPAGSRLDDLGFVQIGGVQPELAEGATI